MATSKTIKFQYFEIKLAEVVGSKVKSNKFMISDWVTYIRNQDLEKKIKEITKCSVRIDEIRYDKELDLWLIRFMRIRENSVPLKFKDKKESKPIDLDLDEYIGEDVTLLYDEKTSISMLQNNRYSLKSKDIEEFFNLYNQYNQKVITIRPILNTIDSDYLEKNNVKAISISFANMMDEPTTFKSSLSDIMKSFYEVGGISGNINIGVGRTKETIEVPSNKPNKKPRLKKQERYLYAKQILEIFEDIKSNKDIIESGKLKVKSEDESTADIVDLFDNVYHEYNSFTLADRENLTIDKIGRYMKTAYLKSKPTLVKLISGK